MSTTTRQHLTVATHLSSEYLIAPEIWAATHDQPIASIELIAGLRLQTEDAAIFRAFANALNEAADSIDAAHLAIAQLADLQAGREINEASQTANAQPFGTPVQHIAVTAPAVDGHDVNPRRDVEQNTAVAS